jgi:hypothetical protein
MIAAPVEVFPTCRRGSIAHATWNGADVVIAKRLLLWVVIGVLLSAPELHPMKSQPR